MKKRKTLSARAAHRGRSRGSLRDITITTALVAGALLALATGTSRAAPLAAAPAANPLSPSSVGGLTLPEFIGPLEFIGDHSGPEGNRSLSYSYRAMGLALEISVTDLGADGVADGIQAPALLERYAEAKQDVVLSTRVRGLKPRHESNVTLGAASNALASPRPPRIAREALFTLKKKREQGASTYLVFTAAHGLVIDARFDVAPGFEEDGSVAHGEILAALGEAIPATGDAVVQARARAASESEAGMKVAIVWDPATPEQESRIWLAYLFARAAFAANENAGGPAAGEREASFEEEVRGRTIALSTFRELRRSDARLASVYFSDIDRVEAAGFLREYVWSYLHHAAWLAPPKDLDLAGFDGWRAGHLLNHVPVTYGHIKFRLAAAQ